MRLARLPLLFAALLALAVTASIADAQAKNQKASKSQTPSRAGQVEADDIIDRMSKAERAVLERLRTSHPLMEVYIQNVAPDEARGWVPTDDNYFLGQLHVDDGPTLRPLGQKEQRGSGVRLRLTWTRPTWGMPSPRWWHPTGGNSIESDTNSRTSAGSSSANRAASSSTSGRFAKARRASSAGSGLRIATTTSSASTAPASDLERRCQACSSGRLSFHMDGWRVNVAPGVWVPSYVYSEETDLNSASSSKSSSK